MKHSQLQSTAADSRPSQSEYIPAPADKLLDFRQVNELLSLRCQTSHTVRALAARGQIRPVRINERVVRYSEASVLDLIAGRAPVVIAASKLTAEATP